MSDSALHSARGAVAIVPNDGADLAHIIRGLYVGTSGHVKVTLLDGTTVTFNSLAAGVIHPLFVKRVFATGTTAASIIGVY